MEPGNLGKSSSREEQLSSSIFVPSGEPPGTTEKETDCFRGPTTSTHWSLESLVSRFLNLEFRQR